MVYRPRSGEIDSRVSRRQTLSALETLFTSENRADDKSFTYCYLYMYIHLPGNGVFSVLRFDGL